jgi:hypothetical protein
MWGFRCAQYDPLLTELTLNFLPAGQQQGCASQLGSFAAAGLETTSAIGCQSQPRQDKKPKHEVEINPPIQTEFYY